MTPSALPPAAQRLRQGRLLLAEAARARGMAAYPARSAALMDAYFRERLDELRTASPGLCATPFALLAVGGYGRSELCPASDVDVLLLFENALPQAAEELSRGLFHPLWDLGLDLGHGVRSLADCLRLAGEDMLVLTSLLDARHIAGDGALAAKLPQRLAEAAPPGRIAAFGQWVLEHNAGRRARHGDSSGLLEPELKNGLGGLRDAHQIRWLLRLMPSLCAGPQAPFTPQDLALLDADHAFVLCARTALHLAAGRKTDRLFFDLQPQVARALGFSGAEPGQGGDGPQAADADAGSALADNAAGDQPLARTSGLAEDPAASLGCGLATGLAVEDFLSCLHQAMTRIRAMRQACWLEAFPPRAEACAPVAAAPTILCGPTGMALRRPEADDDDPAPLLELYVAAARAARPLAWSALRATRAALAEPRRRAAFAALPGILPALLEIFRASGQATESSPPHAASHNGAQPGAARLAGALRRFFAPAPLAEADTPERASEAAAPAVATALQSMLDTGLMAALVPEFAPVEHLVQFDDFHIHPVGKHTLEVVRALAAMRQAGPEERRSPPDGDLSPDVLDRAAELPHFDRLLLAGFCHDLAKPRRDHCAEGEGLARALLGRLGADAQTIDDVAFLVREHLLIPKTATRRDLADESVAAELAQVCGSVERLDMLHLLAVADSRSTGPRAWNPWTAALFDELARKARGLLARGPLSVPNAVDTSRRVRQEALALATATPADGQDEPGLEPDFAARCLEHMPARALLVLDASTVARHMRLARRFATSLAEDRVRKPASKAGLGVAEIDAVPVPGRAFQVSIAATDRPGLFAVMAGVLALHDLHILSAEVLTWGPGSAGPGASLAMDVFVVREPAHGLSLDDLWARVRRAVSYALTDKLSLEYRLEQKRNSPLAPASRAPRGRCAVRVDNAQSDFFTILEVAAPDRLGLLHDLARALCALGARVHLARIATSAGRIHDVFYVRDEDGRKIAEHERLEALRQALLAAARRS